MLRALRVCQGILQVSLTVGGRPLAQAASSGAASALDIQKRGMEMGMEINLASASPRMVVVGATKMTAFAPSRGAVRPSTGSVEVRIRLGQSGYIRSLGLAPALASPDRACN